MKRKKILFILALLVLGILAYFWFSQSAPKETTPTTSIENRDIKEEIYPRQCISRERNRAKIPTLRGIG